jgi:hypothetical protein
VNSALVVEGSSTGTQGQAWNADGGLLVGSYPYGLACIVQAISHSHVKETSTGDRM